MARGRGKTELRACETCGFERPVVIKPVLWEGGKERWRENCEACEAEASARRHEFAAKQMRQKAQDIRLARYTRARAQRLGEEKP